MLKNATTTKMGKEGDGWEGIQMLTSLTKGGGEVSQLLTITDKRGAHPDPLNMADIICEQSMLFTKYLFF